MPRKKSLSEVCNKNQAIIQGKKVSFADERVIRIHWLNKNDIDLPTYIPMGNSVGPILKTSLDRNEKYNFDKLKKVLLEKYIKDANKHCFQQDAIIELGYCSDKQILVVNSFGGADFWEICDQYFKRSNRKIHIYLLTVQTQPIHTNKCVIAPNIQTLSLEPSGDNESSKLDEDGGMADFIEKLNKKEIQNSQAASIHDQNISDFSPDIQCLHQSSVTTPKKKIMGELQNSS
ncbi:hypothetical protein QAD02_021719 [Eretmocerus hayati]|uniref:Uncharacterized protein n=1 Tax=Eretmocerus hayati TaxID=131215 RepID=A0ACC2PR04_9HYME|nr:hypothetical protein QAD02_021719 [Eretmocerus hayati]